MVQAYPNGAVMVWSHVLAYCHTFDLMGPRVHVLEVSKVLPGLPDGFLHGSLTFQKRLMTFKLEGIYEDPAEYSMFCKIDQRVLVSRKFFNYL